MIRKATPADFGRIMEIYEIAKAFMRKTGNMTQWSGGYPQSELVLSDIGDGNMYAVLNGDGDVVACFGLFAGNDPTYDYIEGGKWASDTPYAAIHRVASDGTEKGIFKKISDFAGERYSHLRIDTHADNIPMQRAVTGCGFVHRGTIYLADGAPRLAYDRIKKNKKED